MSDLLIPILLGVAGLGLLVIGGELLVRGASALALMLRISPLVVGLTVVAFGTSAPELAVSVQSAWLGSVDVAVGNVLGSNIINVLVVLGASAVIMPLTVSSRLVRREVPLMVAVSLLLLVLGWDGRIDAIDGTPRLIQQRAGVGDGGDEEPKLYDKGNDIAHITELHIHGREP